MENEALSTEQLERLAKQHPSLSTYYVGVYAADTLPKTPWYRCPQAYIVNTDPKHRSGRHWIALWTDGDIIQLMDSYGLPLAAHQTPHLQTWLRKHFKVVESNTKSLQALDSATCGHYALKFLIERSEGRTFNQFLSQFTGRDYVKNDRKVARWMTKQMKRQVYQE